MVKKKPSEWDVYSKIFLEPVEFFCYTDIRIMRRLIRMRKEKRKKISGLI